MAQECVSYHSRLAELIILKKGEHYAKAISWIREKTSFALSRSALVPEQCDARNAKFDNQTAEEATRYLLLIEIRGLEFYCWNVRFKIKNWVQKRASDFMD